MLFRQEMELEELRVSSESALKELQQLQVNQHHVFCGILVSTSKGMHAEFIPLPREIMVCFSVWCPMRVNETLQLRVGRIIIADFQQTRKKRA